MLRVPRALSAVLVCVLLAGGGVALAASLRGSSPYAVPARDMPSAKLTPGAALSVARARICRAGYASSVRAVPAAEVELVASSYRSRHVPAAHEVDHLISVGLGGSNAVKNLWLEPVAGQWGARAKDRLERRLHALVCAGSLTLKRAQHAISADWVSAYETYLAHAGAPMIPASSPTSTTATTPSITLTTPTTTTVVPVTTTTMSPMAQ
ncbi:MAG: hypothetical protein ABI317_12340 [Gaiellales bacterium]